MKSWSPKRMPDAVARYERAFSWELDTSFLRSDLPYSGCVRARLRRRATVPQGPGFHRFAQLHDWVGLWEPRRHEPVCPFTADLLATAGALIEERRWPTTGLQVLIWGAVAFTLRLKYAEFVILKSFCPWCAISAVSITACAVLVTLDARRLSRAPMDALPG